MRRAIGTFAILTLVGGCGDSRHPAEPDAAPDGVTSCDDNDACTVDFDDGVGGCRHVNLSACALALCAIPSGCGADSDGDGFSDAQEDNDYVDVDCNGAFDATIDLAFPHRSAPELSDVTHTGTGTGRMFPTVADPETPVAASSIAVTIVTPGGPNTATFTYTVDGGVPIGPVTARPVTDVAGNLRLLFYLNNFVAGDLYSFTTVMDPSVRIADKQRPNVYLAYDYMDWDTPGAACATDADCIAGGLQPNATCHVGSCNHRHDPIDPLFRMIVARFADHGITLYIDPHHEAVPHAQVVTFARAGDVGTGPTARCAGADVVAGDLTNHLVVSLFDLKNRPGSAFAAQPVRKDVFHYAVFGHFNTCLTDTVSAPTGNCTVCPSDRSTPRGQPAAGSSGLGELPGNDFIISMGASFDNPLGSVARNPFIEGGVMMHELGHNLGLHHAGDVPEPGGAPNYVSVMNSRYVFSGIQHAATPGSSTSVESLRELDYSEEVLDTLVEANLSETLGTSSAASSATAIIRFVDGLGATGSGPAFGPIDWSGDGSIDTGPVAVDLNGVNGTTETMVGYRDWDHTAGPTGVGGGACVTSADCRINWIRQQVHDLVDSALDPHEPCVGGLCLALTYSFQCTQWGAADAPALRTN